MTIDVVWFGFALDTQTHSHTHIYNGDLMNGMENFVG